MKQLILGGLSLLLVSFAAAPAVKAQPTALNLSPQQSTSKSAVELTPNALVSLAYSGYLQKEGIPSYQALALSYAQKQITAKDLVQSAVKANMLSPQVLENQGYLNAVQNQLLNVLKPRA